MSFIAKNNTVLFEAFGDNLTMICERKKRQTVLLYIPYFMGAVKPRSAQWLRLEFACCRPPILVGSSTRRLAGCAFGMPMGALTASPIERMTCSLASDPTHHRKRHRPTKVLRSEIILSQLGKAVPRSIVEM